MEQMRASEPSILLFFSTHQHLATLEKKIIRFRWHSHLVSVLLKKFLPQKSWLSELALLVTEMPTSDNIIAQAAAFTKSFKRSKST
jgi:hypothetical protein